MYTINELPHLKAFQPIATLSNRVGDQKRYTGVFLCSPSFESSEKMLTGKGLTNTSIRYYIADRIYHEKIGPSTMHRVINISDIPEKIKTNPSVTATRVLSNSNIPTATNRFIDMAMYNNLFFTVIEEKSMTYNTICKEFINLINRVISSDDYRTLTSKTILINLDDWEDYTIKEFGKADSLNNPAAIVYYNMYKFPEIIKELGNVDILFYSNKSSYKLRINPSLINSDSARRFKNEISRVSMNSSRALGENFDVKLEEEEVRKEIANTYVTDRYNLVGDTDSKTTTEIKKEVKAAVDKIDDKKEESIKDTKEEVADEVDKDKELAGKVALIIQSNKVGKSKSSSKRDEELRKKQAAVKVQDKTISELLGTTVGEIPVMDVASKVKTTNKNMHKVRFSNFEKAYNSQLLQKDIVSMITSLNDTRLPVHVRNIKIEDKSDELNYVDRYYVQLEDENRVRHQLTFDMPKFIDDKFMYLHGNRKEIVKQQMMLPIVKDGPNQVQIVSNYKKIFVHRFGAKLSPEIERIRKYFEKNMAPSGIKFKLDNVMSGNKQFLRTLEIDEFAAYFDYIKSQDFEIYFNLSVIDKLCSERNIPMYTEIDGSKDSVCIGFFKKNDPIYVSLEDEGLKIVDLVKSTFTNSSDINSIPTGKRFMYTGGVLMSKKVPLALLVAYHEGMSSLLRRTGMEYRVSEKRSKLDAGERMLEFEDCYIIYKPKTVENILLMNGLSLVPTRAYKYAEMDDKETYLDIFYGLFNQRNIASAFDNFYDFMIDPITKEVLEDLNLPNNYIDVLLYANKLLVDGDYTEETDLSLYRIRSNEILNSYLYNAIANAYSTYIATANNPNPIKISIPRDTIVKSVLTAQTVEDYSVLNPIVEVEKGRAVTAKGPSGANLDRAYTMAKRSYSPSMTGVMAMSTSPDANVGVVRAMSTEPSIVSARGYIEDNQERLDELKDTNIFSPGELLSPLGASRDDTIRTSMAIKQSKHIIPVENASPVLISNGIEQTLPYHTGSDFSIVAKEDGKVIEIDEKTNTVVIEYKQPTDTGDKFLAIDTSKRVVKNGAGGFYLANQLLHNLKVGQTVKKNDVLAYDKNFYSNDNDGVRFNIGSLEKIAIFSNAATMEDSAFVTQKLTKDIGTKITMPKSISLGKNANIDYIVKIGDKIKVGDELVRFESSFKDDSLNKFLDTVRTELNEEIRSLGKKPITSKYTGEVVDIKIYSTVDTEELSPSLQKLVKEHYARINKRKSLLNKYDKRDVKYKMGMYQDEPTSKVDSPDGKVKGEIVGEGILIQIFVEYTDIGGVGDKIAFFTALKGIIGDVVEPGLEPFSLNEPDEEISAFVAPGAVLARMTPSILLTAFGNKTLVGLKKKLKEIYEE